MKIILKLEDLFCLCLALNYAWWWFFLLLLAPDLSMLGYLLSPRSGALVYNLIHHKGIAIALYLPGAYFDVQMLQ